MRSLFVSHRYFPPHVGGITRMVDRIARELGPDRVCCLTGLRTGTARNGFPPPDYPRVYRSRLIFSGRTRVTRALAWGGTLSRIILRERPRAVLLGTVDDALYGVWLKHWLGLPTITLVYGNELLDVLAEPQGRSPLAHALQDSNRVIAVSRFTASLAERAGVRSDRIEVVYPGCDATEFSPRAPSAELRGRLLGSRSADRIILTTGNLVARKGHDMVIRALPRILAAVPALTYLIVGDGPCRDGLDRLARELGIRDRVVFAGQVRDQELPDYYALCDGFVMPSRVKWEDRDVEGFGIVYLEANACGKAVVGGRSGGVPEAVLHEETGLLADPNHPEDIANAVLRILTDPVGSARMGERGRARVIRDFGWTLVADRIHAILASAAHPAPR